MQQAIVSTLPFLGQIVKITTRDGKEYDVKISEELPDNDRVFSIMFRNSNSNNGGGRNNTNIKPPERPELPEHLRPHANNQAGQNSQTSQTSQCKKEKKTNINKKIDCTKAGSSISLDDMSKQPFKLNF
jgi:hypothetical protein